MRNYFLKMILYLRLNFYLNDYKQPILDILMCQHCSSVIGDAEYEFGSWCFMCFFPQSDFNLFVSVFIICII